MLEAAAKRIIRAAGGDESTCIGILGLSFNAGSSDVRDTLSAKVIAELCRCGYRNFLAYDPEAMKEFQTHYNLRNYPKSTLGGSLYVHVPRRIQDEHSRILSGWRGEL